MILRNNDEPHYKCSGSAVSSSPWSTRSLKVDTQCFSPKSWADRHHLSILWENVETSFKMRGRWTILVPVHFIKLGNCNRPGWSLIFRIESFFHRTCHLRASFWRLAVYQQPARFLYLYLHEYIVEHLWNTWEGGGGGYPKWRCHQYPVSQVYRWKTSIVTLLRVTFHFLDKINVQLCYVFWIIIGRQYRHPKQSSREPVENIWANQI